MWSVFLSSLCSDAINRKIGELNGAVKVCDHNSSSVPISIATAEELSENFGIITGYAASAGSICSVLNADPFTVEDSYAASDIYAHRVIACTSMNILDSVISGDIVMQSGNGITEEDEAKVRCKIVVSEHYAEKNSKKIGDILVLSWKNKNGEKEKQDFVIGGIYQIRDTLTNEPIYNYQIAENTVFIPFSTYRAICGNTGFSLDSLYFYLKHHNETTVDRLNKRLQEIGYENIELKLYTPENVTAGISKLLGVLQITSVMIMLCGILVLFVIIFLGIQSRSKEIGILIALGKPSARIVGSLLTEVFVIGACSSFFATIFFYISASAGIKGIVSYLISDGMTSEFQNTSSETFFQNMMQRVIILESTDVSVSQPILLALGMYVIVCLITWLVISFAAKKTNPMLVFGENT